MSICRSCHQEIKWGRGFGGKWIPLDPEPHASGTVAFLPDGQRIMDLPRRWKTFEDVPAALRATVPDEMREWWSNLIEAPRYRLHSRECRIDVVESVGYTAEEVLG